MKYLETFKVQGCDEIILEYYKKMSGKDPDKKAKISDRDEIGDIIGIMGRLPEQGDMMKKPADGPYLKAEYHANKRCMGFLEYYRE